MTEQDLKDRVHAQEDRWANVVQKKIMLKARKISMKTKDLEEKEEDLEELEEDQEGEQEEGSGSGTERMVISYPERL